MCDEYILQDYNSPSRAMLPLLSMLEGKGLTKVAVGNGQDTKTRAVHAHSVSKRKSFGHSTPCIGLSGAFGSRPSFVALSSTATFISLPRALMEVR